MRTNIKKFLLGCSLALGGLTAGAQGLEGIIVEDFHTVTQADANFINGLGNSTYSIVAGSKVYRVYVDMAPNYRFLTVGGSVPDDGIGVHALDFSTTTTFWNDDNFGTEFPAQTRRASTGTIFDTYITIGSTGIVGGASPCGALGSGLAQVGVLRTADTNGDLTSCGVFPGFTGNDGSIPGTVPALTTNLSGIIDFTALTGSASSFVIGGNSGDSYATLPANTGIDPTNTNRVLIGQFTTDGVFSFHINVAIQSAAGDVEFYVWSNPILTEVVSPFLTYPQAACNPPVFSASGSNGPLCAGSTLNLNASATGDATIAYSWSGPNAFSSTIQNPTIANATSAETGMYTVTATNGCAPDATAMVNVVVNAAPNAGSNGTLTICAGSTVTTAQLFAQLGGAPNAGGTWSPALAGAGVYTYTVTGTAPCTNATSTVTVSEQAQPNAGTNGTLTICAGSTVTASQLFAQLGGSPNAGGTWSPALTGAGVYTYTVNAVAPCTGTASATVTVTEQAQPNAGTNGTLSICSTASSTSLFAQLGGSPNAGGSWSGPSPVVGGNYDPSTMDAGVYTYTVAAVAPCTGATTATVTVTETATGTWYEDADNDGAGDPNVVLDQCDQPVGYVANNNDLCPADMNKIAPGACGCGVADVAAAYYADTDGDGFGDPATSQVGFTCSVPTGFVTNNTDNCPTTFGLIGDACDDLDVNTNNDVIGSNCVCAGTPVGVDCEGVPNGPALPGTACNDGLATTGNDTWTAGCQCVGLVIDCEGVAGGSALPGTACNDGLATTGNDVYGANCVCAGQLIDCLGVAGGSALPGTPCDDSNPNSTNDLYDVNCQCSGTLANDCLGVPGGTAQPGTACDDGLATTGNDVYSANCVCAGQVIDCNGVIGGPALPGTTCDDNNPSTINDLFGTNCTCAGTPVGPNTECVSLEITTDANSSQTSWEIVPEGGGAPLCNGAALPPSSTITESCCLPVGCYALRVLDSAGDGIANGGYVLRETASGERIIDNRGNFSTGAESSIQGLQGFCLPIGGTSLIGTSCDKLDWVNFKYLVCQPDPSVANEWINGGANNVQDANSGYEFWMFDPNGTYSYRKFRSHNVSDGKSPANANRACHMKINNWFNSALTPLIPQNTLINVRVRGRVNGANSVFGPACTMVIDPARAACPLIKLLDSPGDSRSSCNATRTYGNGNFVWATPPQFIPAVSAAQLRFQFRFRNMAEGFETIRTSNSYVLPLNWTGAGMLNCGTEYTVDVRVSKDGGATWCIDGTTPATPFQPWGEVCTLTIAPCASNFGTSTSLRGESSLTMYPNPNSGGQLFISLSEVAADVNTVSMDIFDMTGKRVAARTITVQNGFINQSVELNGELSGGLYMVNITAGDKTFTERLVIQP